MPSDIRNASGGSVPASGRFVIRMEPGLHATLREAAAVSGLSLNEYAVRKLALPGVLGPDAAPRAVARAAAIVGGNLAGVVVFGSWARGEATETSDIDMLIVVDEGRPITRALYHEWDAEPLRWGELALEPHFVRLPDAGARISGLWAEVAIDGLVLFERGFEVSRRLVEIRRRIASGELVRRWSNGHPYWVAA